MNDFITIAIAHDATCEPGEELLFHGMSGSKGKGSGSDDKFLTFGCLVVTAFVAIVVCFVIWAIWRLI